MTEANIPPMHSSSQEQTAAERRDPVQHHREAPLSAVGDEPTAHLDDWQLVDFPNAISIDAMERRAMYDSGDVQPRLTTSSPSDRPRPLTVLPDLSSPARTASTSPDPSASEPPAPPEVSDLIALIQDLNQCNHALLERVNQLEVALDEAQTAAEAGSDRPDMVLEPSALEPSADQRSQLPQGEVAHHQQRQQIRIDTLTAQFTSSQQRIAELERECALTQQRYQAQTQHLTELEAVCRDLRSRLHRQQRYTLQFKVALEKSLEVPLPSYLEGADAEAIADGEMPAVLQEARGIRPWSAQAISDHVSKIEARLQSALHDVPPISAEEHLDTILPVAPLVVPPATPPIDVTTESPAESSTESSTESPAELPTESPTDRAASDSAKAGFSPVTSFTQTPLPPKLTALSQAKRDPEAPSALSLPGEKERPAPLDPALLQQLDAAVQPLLDSVMEVIKAEQPTGAAATPPSGIPVVTPRAAETELADGVPSFDDLSANSTVSPEAEESLWQDLARLVDISTDDVVQASLSGNFDAFAAINYDAVPGQGTPSPKATSPKATSPKATGRPSLSLPQEQQAIAPPPTPLTLPAPPAPPLAPPSPRKKRTSLASIDLPTFPRA
ncbi:MAG: hypothetical protein EA367_12670 [Leptolyngbya sp. DLM2.Bin15]|nr:MAG: hypothetical protein EA367_12670 [Leptolyngbya sp. DLM2.Bin15]